MAWMQPQLTDPPMGPTDEIRKLQHRMLYAYPVNSKAVELGVTESGIFDKATDQALRNLQPHLVPPQPADGVLTYATKVATGVIVAAPVSPKKRFIQQGVGFSTDAFLMGNASHSYVDAVSEGSAELLRLALPDPRPKIGDAYSMGGDVLRAAIERWPADRRDEWKLFTVFGNPSRRSGPTLLGNDPGGSGISGVTYPEWTWDRLYDFTHEGDMYPNAKGLLPQFYQILTRMEASADFALYLFRVLSSSFGPIMLGLVGSVLPGAGALAGILPLITGGKPTEVTDGGTPNLLAMITNIPAIIQSLLVLLKFIQTNAHYHYHDQPETFWRGLTAVDCAAQIIAEKAQTGVVYTIPGTVSWWNDGPPAWTAWKLP